MNYPPDVLDDRAMCLGLMLEDELMFTLNFWEEDLTVPSDRDDLGELAGNQLITSPQKMLLLDRSRLVAAATGRKTIKTVNIESKSIQWPLWNRRQRGHDEAMVVTPGQTHLKLLMDRVFPRIDNTPFFSLFCGRDDQLRGEGLQRWATNIWVSWRLEGLSGTDKNMAGPRAKWVLADEMAFGNEVCHGSRIQSALPRARFIYSGVPNFTLSPFRRITSEPFSDGWSVHTGSTYYYNPLYGSQEVRMALIASFDGVQDPMYQTQVLGVWTDQMGASAWPPGCFALHARHSSYVIQTPAPKSVADHNWAIVLHGIKPEFKHYVMGWDYGYSPDPAVLMVLGSHDLHQWYATARFRFREVMEPDQVDLVIAIGRVLQGRVVAVSSDNRQAIQTLSKRRGHKMKCLWAEPQGSTIRIDVDGDLMFNDEGKEVKDRNRKLYSELSRDSMAFSLLKAPYYLYMALYEDDHELLDELAGTSSYDTRAGYTVYAAAKKTPGSKSDEDHNTDALRFATHAAYKIWEEGATGQEERSTEGLGFMDQGVMPGQQSFVDDMSDRLYPQDMRTGRIVQWD